MRGIFLGLCVLAACGDDLPTGDDLSKYYALCATPRTGTNPATNKPYSDKQGTETDEKRFIRAWTDELYLWYSEVPDVAPTTSGTPLSYFNLMKTPATTPSGKPKDQFHFTYPTPEWIALSQSGVDVGYGVSWVLVSSRPPRKLVVALNQPGSPAAMAGVDRGAVITTIDGEDVENGSDTAKLNKGLYPSAENEEHTFTVIDLGATAPRTVTLKAAKVTSAPVQKVGTIGDTKVGYILFNDHIATAEAQLIAAVNQLKTLAISDLVLDLRYNGGGYLDMASELSYMIAGPDRTAGKTFELVRFNDKHPTSNPISGEALEPTKFWDKSLGFSGTSGQPLPHLDLPRVFVLTSGGTCSASEAIINGLRGVDVQVIQIGNTTCGKPYGFYPIENCGTTYFSIQFQGVNDKGFGDYADGFVPGGPGDTGLPGCVAADDLSHALGDPNEGRLAAALAYRATGVCPAAKRGDGGPEALIAKSPWHMNRIYR